ncbi:SPOR domain-containing protein [Hoeflea sp. G2-23]|uniref:SPOR domain-containing protein n=1 Tax=Hoeflea algicola TaxID=2983763 RepID=A0ABT3Z5R0_9HYPH|nr:SPOR domain-containing protein [Hoeflea algicola]MCY0147085.1 SPOR domain-containing protein [Hoeflea algicola]
MVDQLDSNTRTQEPDVEVDDPLAELARIIGYERPVEQSVPDAAENEPVASAFDLEAELMRELDVVSAVEPAMQAEALNADDTKSDADDDAGADMDQPAEPAEDLADPSDDDSVLADAWLGNKPDSNFDADADAVLDAETNMGGETEFAFDSEAGVDAVAFVDVEQVAAEEAVADFMPDLASLNEVDETAGTAEVTEFGAWEAPELEAEWEPRPETPFIADASDLDDGDDDVGDQVGAETDELGQVISRDLGPAAASDVAEDDVDDQVLADMFRFELPAHTASSGSNEPVAIDVPELNDPETLEYGDADADLAAAFELDPELATPEQSVPELVAPELVANDTNVVDVPDVEPTDDVASPIDAPVLDWEGYNSTSDNIDDAQAGSDMPPEPAIDTDMDDGVVDFEDYLSAELDVFEHQVAMSDAPAADEVPSPVPDHSPDSATQAGEVDGWNDAALDGDDLVFDEAAEELLSDIAEEPAATGAYADGGWSEGAINDSLALELEEELEDMFGLTAPVDLSPVAFDESDDLEFDLEQVLAETVVEAEAAPDQSFEPELPASHEFEAAAPELEEFEPQAHELLAVDNVTADDGELEQELLEEPQPETERDEIAEAFFGLGGVVEDTIDVSDAGAGHESANETSVVEADYPTETPTEFSSEHTADPAQGDWLAGFETDDQTSQSAHSDDDGFFFDADMIAEPEDSVEAVADFDVPELAHDEPVAMDPDFDNEIDREFADIIDRDTPDSEVAAASVVTGSLGAATGMAHDWSRDVNTERGYEGSGDYIALERELGADDVHVAPPYDDGEGDDHEPSPLDSEYATGMVGAPAAGNESRGPFLALVVLGVAVLAGAGAFGWSMMSTDDSSVDGGPRIIRADKEPVKVVPENPGGVTVPNQDKAVYDRVAGGDAAQPRQPALINSAEEPVDVVQRTLDPDVLPLEGRGSPAVKSEERLTADGTSEANAGSATQAAPVVSPRKVRTMIVKPDGSIVAREDPTPEPVTQPATVAAEKIEPAAAPLQAANQQTPEAETAVPAAPDVAAVPAEAAPAPAEEEVAAVEAPDAGTTAPVRVVTTQQIRAPIPQGRPADQPVNVVGTVTQGGTVAAAPTAPSAPAQDTEVASAPAPAAAPVANPGGYYVQIASQPTVDGAQASWRTLSNRYSSMLGGRDVDIQRADIPGKGVFHRVRVVGGTRDQANALCSRYKSAGGSCFVSR